jgi:hypothetical protein
MSVEFQDRRDRTAPNDSVTSPAVDRRKPGCDPVAERIGCPTRASATHPFFAFTKVGCDRPNFLSAALATTSTMIY